MLLAPPEERRHQTKRDVAYLALQTAITTCALQPGQRLVIESLARELGISPIPVREALQMLQSEGLVINIPHAGAVVSPIDVDSIVDVFTTLEGLETAAARRATERAEPAALDRLAAICKQMDDVLIDDGFEAWADLNRSFHVGISQLGGLPMLQEMTTRVLARWDRVRRYFFSQVLVHRLHQAQEEHREILAALAERDADWLEALLRQHNRRALVAYMNCLQTPSEPDQAGD